jgi:hypothetical protein
MFANFYQPRMAEAFQGSSLIEFGIGYRWRKNEFQAAWRNKVERPACPQRHLLGAAVRGALAGRAGELRSIHHLLQSLRSLAVGGRLGQDHEHTAGTYDAAVQMIDTSVVRVHQHGACITRNRRQGNGPVTRRVDQQDSCGRRYQWASGAARADSATIDLQAALYLA